MKRTLTLGLGILALAVAPLLAQQQPMGKIHGQVINPVGTAQATGTVSLRNDAGKELYTFPVDANGEFSGSAAPGTYTLIFRDQNTPKNKQVDHIDNVKIVAGQTTEQNDDMSREAYIKTLSPDQQKQLAELRKHNAEALKNNSVVKQINGDLGKVSQDIRTADTASATAAQQLGSGATSQAIAAKANDIKTQAYTDVETLMTKDTAATAGRNDVSILWARLGQGELGLKKYDKAIEDFNKAIDMDSKSKKPNPEVQGLAQSGLGEAYARTGKVDQAAAAFDAAAKANPKSAAIYLKNQAVIYFQMGNAKAQVAAADKAIAADPNNPILYYLKGQGLVGNATVDPKTNRIVLPPGCADAYQKYLQLAPDGPYANEVKGILQQAGEKVSNTYRAGRKR